MGHLNVLTTWYIVFSDYEVTKHWSHFFMKEGFRHCYCFRQIGDYIYWVDPTTSNIDSAIIVGDVTTTIKTILDYKRPSIVVAFTKTFDFDNKMFRLRNMLPTCVNVVKMFIGINSTAQTPYQLYKDLLYKGAQKINSLSQYNETTKSTK